MLHRVKISSLLIVVCLLLTQGCSNPKTAPPPSKPRVYTTDTIVSMPIPKGGPEFIQPGDIPKIMPLVARLEADPSTVVLKIGEKYSYLSIKITAFDANNNKLGRLLIFDTKATFGAVQPAGPNLMVAVKPGENVLKFVTPSFNSSGGVGPAPEVIVKVVVIKP